MGYEIRPSSSVRSVPMCTQSPALARIKGFGVRVSIHLGAQKEEKCAASTGEASLKARPLVSHRDLEGPRIRFHPKPSGLGLGLWAKIIAGRNAVICLRKPPRLTIDRPPNKNGRPWSRANRAYLHPGPVARRHRCRRPRPQAPCVSGLKNDNCSGFEK